MKKEYNFLLVAFFLITFAKAQVREVIWSEDFNNYPHLFGIEGSGSGVVNIGGYDPSTFTKWQLEDNGANLVNFSDYAAVFSSTAYLDKHLRAQDTDSGIDWVTENINISSYDDVAVSMFVAEIGDHEDSEVSGGDWFDVYYSFDDGATYTLLPNWKNLGNASHTLTGDTVHGASCTPDSDFGSTKIFFNIPANQDNLKLKITLKNGSTTENFILDDVLITGVNNTLSIDDVTIESNTLIYPNPANNEVNISLSNGSIKSIFLYDINQRLIKAYPSVSNKAYKLDLTNFSKGLYFINIHDEKGNKRTNKLIIK
jgi:hypothetical protein